MNPRICRGMTHSFSNSFTHSFTHSVLAPTSSVRQSSWNLCPHGNTMNPRICRGMLHETHLSCPRTTMDLVRNVWISALICSACSDATSISAFRLSIFSLYSWTRIGRQGKFNNNNERFTFTLCRKVSKQTQRRRCNGTSAKRMISILINAAEPSMGV